VLTVSRVELEEDITSAVTKDKQLSCWVVFGRSCWTCGDTGDVGPVGVSCCASGRVVSCRIQQKQSVQVGPLCNLAGRLSFVKVGRHLRGDFVFFVLLLCCV
jgi:hypothetical protein